MTALMELPERSIGFLMRMKRICQVMAARDLKYKLDPEYSTVYQSGTTGSPASKALS
jgi:hypothetical protein